MTFSIVLSVVLVATSVAVWAVLLRDEIRRYFDDKDLP